MRRPSGRPSTGGAGLSIAWPMAKPMRPISAGGSRKKAVAWGSRPVAPVVTTKSGLDSRPPATLTALSSQ